MLFHSEVRKNKTYNTTNKNKQIFYIPYMKTRTPKATEMKQPLHARIVPKGTVRTQEIAEQIFR